MRIRAASAGSQLLRADITLSLIPPVLALLAAVAAIFMALPSLDISTAHYFYVSADNAFVGKLSVSVEWMRRFFSTAYIAICVLAVAGLIASRLLARGWLGLHFTKWLFLAVCLVMGPGVVANLAFKDHWGRARPNQITEFGGNKAFSAPLTPSEQCNRNCSFISGEASSTFTVFFAAAYLFRRRSTALVVAGIAAGCANGLLRMLVGAHFLSDVIFAGLFMALTVAVINFVFETVADAGQGADPPPLIGVPA